MSTKFEVLYTFTPNKSYAYLLNVEPSNLVFLKTYNAEFTEIIVTFTNQNARPLEREDKVNLTLLIKKTEMTPFSSLAVKSYSVEPRTRKYVKGYRFLLFARKYKKQLLETGLDSLKIASKQVVHKALNF